MYVLLNGLVLKVVFILFNNLMLEVLNPFARGEVGDARKFGKRACILFECARKFVERARIFHERARKSPKRARK